MEKGRETGRRGRGGGGGGGKGKRGRRGGRRGRRGRWREQMREERGRRGMGKEGREEKKDITQCACTFTCVMGSLIYTPLNLANIPPSVWESSPGACWGLCPPDPL